MGPNFMSYLKCTVNLESSVTASQKNTGHLNIPKIIAQLHGHLVKALNCDPGDLYSSVTLGKSNLPGSGSHLQNGCGIPTGLFVHYLQTEQTALYSDASFKTPPKCMPVSFAKQPAVTEMIPNKCVFIKWLGNKICLCWSWCEVFATGLPLHQWSSLVLGALKGSLHGLDECCCPKTNINPHEYLHSHYFFSWFLMKLLFAWCWLPNFIHSKFFKNHKLFCMRLIYPSRSPNWIRNPLAEFYTGASGGKGKGSGGTWESEHQMWKRGKILKRSRKRIENINIFLLN